MRVQRVLRRESIRGVSEWTCVQQVSATYRVALILDLGCSDSTRVALVAEDVFVQVFLVVNLADDLCQALGCEHPVALTSLEGTDAKTLAQEEFLAEGSWDS